MQFDKQKIIKVLTKKEITQMIRKDLKERRHINLAEASEIIGKSRQSLYNIMNKGHQISPKTAELMHKHFGYSIDFLRHGVGPMFDEQDPAYTESTTEKMVRIKVALQQCHKILSQNIKVSKPLNDFSVKINQSKLDFDCQSDTEKELFYEISMWCGLVRQLAEPENIKSTLENEKNQ